MYIKRIINNNKNNVNFEGQAKIDRIGDRQDTYEYRLGLRTYTNGLLSPKTNA